MDGSFEVIDLKSGNVIGGFEREDEAFASLRHAFGAHGTRAIAALSLMHITDEDQFLIAMQDDLECLVRDAETGVVNSVLWGIVEWQKRSSVGCVSLESPRATRRSI